MASGFWVVTRWLPRTSCRAFIRRSRVDPSSFKIPAGESGVVGHREQQVLDGDVFVLEAFGLVFGFGEQAVQPAGDVDLVGRAGGG